MVGLADSYLSELGYIVVPQVTILPFVLAMWFHNRSLTGWAFPSAFLLWWQIAIRDGLNVNNPLLIYASLPYTPLDLQEAQYLFFVIFSTLTIACAMMGTAIAYLLNLPVVLPIEAVWPDSPGLSFNSPNINLSGATTGGLKRQDAAVPDTCGLSAFGFDRIPRPYFHFFVTLVLMVITVALPFILFEWIYSATILGAFLSALLIPLVGYLAAGLFWRYYTSLYIFGPNDNNMKDRENQIAVGKKDDNSDTYNDPSFTDNPAMTELVYGNTNYGIWKAILIMGGLHVLTFLLIGGIASFSDPVDVDVMWITGITLLLVITVLIAIIAFVYHGVVKARSQGCNGWSFTNSVSQTVDDTNEAFLNKANNTRSPMMNAVLKMTGAGK